MLRYLQRLAIWASLSLVGLTGLGLILAVGVPLVLRLGTDPGFARAYFTDLVPYERVLASRKWHRVGAQAWDCTYAVVDLAETAPDRPGSRTETAKGWQFRWGGAWQPTPAAALGDTTRDALGYCGQYFSDDLNARLLAAISAPGSWYSRDRVGETLHLYSRPQGLAARIRYGD